MDQVVTITNVHCPKCGANIFSKKYIEKGIYICEGKDETSVVGKCWTAQYLCKTCNKIYPESNFGKHGDVYECKTCGSVNWPYTDRQKENTESLNKIREMNSKLDSILKSNKNIFG